MLQTYLHTWFDTYIHTSLTWFHTYIHTSRQTHLHVGRLSPERCGETAPEEPSHSTTTPTAPPKILRRRSLPDIKSFRWKISDKSVFGTSYHYCRGRPRNDCVEPRCDDAFGDTNRCLVLCDGVGGAGPPSGRWARICVKECLTEAAARG